jgi:hypothetical protein
MARNVYNAAWKQEEIKETFIMITFHSSLLSTALVKEVITY